MQERMLPADKENSNNPLKSSPKLTGLILFLGLLLLALDVSAVALLLPADTVRRERRGALPDTLQQREFIEVHDAIPARDTLVVDDRDIDEPVILADTLTDQVQPREHSPLKATMLSATLPGLGQAYNGKYWKIPIVYAGFGAIAYFVDFNNSQYQTFRRAYVARVDGNPNTTDNFPLYSTDRLQRATNYYRRNLEITYIAAAALYVLNILDATVDAHLLDFDVGEDLTLNVQPHILPGAKPVNGIQSSFAGMKLTFRF